MTIPRPACAVEDCDSPSKWLGWCRKHYQRYKRHGDPLGGGIAHGEALAYYLAHVDDGLYTTDCVIWPFGKSSAGYGVLWSGDWSRGVHVLALTHHRGPRPQGAQAAHMPILCHSRACFNFRHLMWSSVAGNAADRVADSTDQAGERSALARLTWADVRGIRAKYAAGGVDQSWLAARYGVDKTTISCVVTGKTWKVDADPLA